MNKLIYIAIFFISVNTYSQYGKWYLEKIEVNTTVVYPPTGLNPTLDFLNYDSTSIDIFNIFSCGTVAGKVDHNEANNSFHITEGSLSPCESSDQDILNFENIHKGDFYEFGQSNTSQSYSYIETQHTGYRTLVITNTNTGDQAFYQDQALSITNMNELSDVQLYPNPVKEQLQIESNLSIAKAYLYDITGKQIKTYHMNQLSQPIDMSSLQPGVYFITLYSDLGKHTTKKLTVE